MNGSVAGSLNGHATAFAEAEAAARPASLPHLLVWSASDEKALQRMTLGYQDYYTTKVAGDAAKLDGLAFTLAARRSHMLWRTFSIAKVARESDDEMHLAANTPVRSSSESGLAFVFTGQGAQYVDMGWDLLQYPVFASFMRQIQDIYRKLGCQWSIFGKRSSESPRRSVETDSLTFDATCAQRSCDLATISINLSIASRCLQLCRLPWWNC